ncbi:MAG TPA: hypothetical protein VKR30_10985 [Candidatus Limnocylindrales bacterium]|nr:hypothetical protein [Candidatus Limnocylindrales bacterium]
MRLSNAEARRRALTADHGVLATIGFDGAPDLVPACFVIDGDLLAIPVDTVKPKASTSLGRSRNLDRDPRATFLVERWDPADWSRLWWVRLELERIEPPGPTVAALAASLAGRYPQYREQPFAALLVLRIVDLAGWSAT